MKELLVLLLVVNLFACTNIKQETSQSVEIDNNGEPDGPHTSTEWKIWALSTAAPSFIAANCTVIDSDGKTVLREGLVW